MTHNLYNGVDLSINTGYLTGSLGTDSVILVIGRALNFPLNLGHIEGLGLSSPRYCKYQQYQAGPQIKLGQPLIILFKMVTCIETLPHP